MLLHQIEHVTTLQRMKLIMIHQIQVMYGSVRTLIGFLTSKTQCYICIYACISTAIIITYHTTLMYKGYHCLLDRAND